MELKTLVSPKDGEMKWLNVQEINVEPGETKVDLSLDSMDAFYCVLSGYGRLDVDAYGYALSAQTGVYIPANNPHRISNSGNIPMRIVRYFVPAE